MSQPPAIPSSTVSRSAVICWVVIVASIGYVAGRVFWQKSTDDAATTQSSGSMDLELSARVLVGQKQIAADIRQPAMAVQDALRTLETKARTTTDQLCVAIVAAELGGASEGLARLGEVEPRAATQPVSDNVAVLRAIYSGGDEPNAEQQRELVEDLGWFGKLALTFHHGASDPQRRNVIKPAKRAAWTATGAVFFVGELVLTGMILLIVAIVMLNRGRIRRAYVPLIAREGRPAFLEAFAIYISLFVIFGDVLHRITSTPPLALYLLTTALLPVALIWPTRRGLSFTESRKGFGWHRGAGIFTEMGCGLIGYITGLPIIAIAFVMTFFLTRVTSGPGPSHPIMNELRGGWAHVLAIYFLACIWAPVMEETMFRGALFNYLRSRHGWLMSSLIVGLLFALVHPQGWTAIPVLGSIGAVLASVREWRGSLIGPMTAHALNNATAITIVLLLIL